MKTLITLLLLCHVGSGVKHSLMFYFTVCSEVPNVPDFIIAADLEDVSMAYYDNNMEAPEARHDWVRKLMQDDPTHWEKMAQDCMNYQQLLQSEIESFKHNSSQTPGVHIIQQILGCEWDNETDYADGYKKYGYNAKDFITFDVESAKWIAETPQADVTKQEWDRDEANNRFWKPFLTTVCPSWLKMYLKYASTFLQRRDLPSVSLLQKSPSSPVSCHATGFHPNRADMFWRKDGEELHEDVDHGEILPNHDGTFQTSVGLNISSVGPEDWSRYNCVFQLCGAEDDIVTKLDKAEIRTNWGKTQRSSNMTVHITATLVALAIVAIMTVVGLTVFKMKKAEYRPPALEKTLELSEKLNPDGQTHQPC